MTHRQIEIIALEQRVISIEIKRVKRVNKLIYHYSSTLYLRELEHKKRKLEKELLNITETLIKTCK